MMVFYMEDCYVIIVKIRSYVLRGLEEFVWFGLVNNCGEGRFFWVVYEV